MSQRTSSSGPRPLLLAWLLALGGCFDDCGNDDFYDPQPGPGELGNGEFHYRCIGDGDPACSDGGSVGNFPARVAVGGRFELEYTWNDDVSRPPPDLRSGASERLRLQGEIFTPLAEGYTAVLALLPDSDIGDLIHIRASTPIEAALQYQRVDYSAYSLVEGDELRFDAITRDGDAYVLAGLLTFTFAVDDPAVAEIVGTGDAHVILRAQGEGTTVLHATLGDLTTDLEISVGQGPVTSTDPTTDAQTTTDSSTTDDSTVGTDTTESTTGTTDTTDTGDTAGTTDTTGGVL